MLVYLSLLSSHAMRLAHEQGTAGEALDPALILATLAALSEME
jgi:hypothetical protein